MAILKTNDFSQLYRDGYFLDGNNTLRVNENKNDASPTDLIDVTFLNVGQYTQVKSTFLSKSSEVFASDKDCHAMRFRSDCDSILLVERGGTSYLVWIELKSGFKEVCHSAIFQLAGSYVRMKSCLSNFAKYNSDNYKEVAIAVSYPDGYIKANNSVVKSYKKAIALKPTIKDKIEKNVRLLLKTGKDIYLQGSQFGCDTLGLNDNIVLKNLRFIHVPVTSQHGSVDLGKILDNL